MRFVAGVGHFAGVSCGRVSIGGFPRPAQGTVFGLSPPCQNAIFSDLYKCCIICELCNGSVVKDFMELSVEPSL